MKRVSGYEGDDFKGPATINACNDTYPGLIAINGKAVGGYACPKCGTLKMEALEA